ncbi:distal tail protein Dit [Lacticaseibacillus rhamnosus]|uniref:distal tail protein Dit n=1 Tax=Lacticaseibacillus rhamnosus TaxID=47715 RepID=UPI00189EADAD|nr:distal tail protein Dit [Lacticaseibacillus rhamnosus]
MKQAGIKITYAGVDITQWMYVQMVERDVGTNHVNTMQKVGISDGQMLQYMSRDVKTIVVTGIVMNDDLVPLRRSLAAAIDADEPQQLIFGDEPDKYYLAIVDSQPTFTEGFRSGTISISFICPDGGIAHSVATKTADNMPYKDVPVNLQPDSNFTQLPSTWTLDGVVFDNSGEFAKLTSQGTGMQRIYGAGNPFASIPAGSQYTISFTAYSAIAGTSFKIGSFTSMNLFKLTTTATYYKFSATKNSSDANALSVILLNAGDIIYIKKVKLELGASASPWSPNPADPEYYSDTITVHNGGTYPVEPVITATMHADNGVVAFVNDQGSVLQFGSPSEIDGVVRQKSERVYYFDFENEPKGIVMNDGALTYPNYRDNPSTPNKQKGIFSYGRPDGYDNAIAYPNTERNPSNYWSGPSMSGKLAANSNGKQNGNFEWRNLIRFATMTNWAGRVEFNLTYEGKIVASLALYDQSTTDDQVMFEGKIHDGNDARMLFHEALPRDLYSRANSFAVISKMGDQLTFRVDRVGGGNVIKPFTISGFASQPIDGWTAWFSAFSDVLEANMGWQDSYFDWINVDYWTDVPNRFKKGDVVKIDVAKRVVSLNGAEDPTLQAVGNNWEGFQLLPGKNTIQVLQSDWAERYMCQVEWREAWL